MKKIETPIAEDAPSEENAVVEELDNDESLFTDEPDTPNSKEEKEVRRYVFGQHNATKGSKYEARDRKVQDFASVAVGALNSAMKRNTSLTKHGHAILSPMAIGQIGQKLGKGQTLTLSLVDGQAVAEWTA